jgi:hypothetical protein
MKNTLYILVSLMFLVTSCNKSKAQLKRIDGNWRVDLARVSVGEGFTFYDSLPMGEISISSSLRKINGRLDFVYSEFGMGQVQDSFVTNNATFTMNDKGDRIKVFRENDTIEMRILLSSKKNLELEYYDEQQYRLRRFALNKN